MNLSTVFESLQQAVTELQNYLPDLSSLDIGSWFTSIGPIIQQAQQYLAELWSYVGGLI